MNKKPVFVFILILTLFSNNLFCMITDQETNKNRENATIKIQNFYLKKIKKENQIKDLTELLEIMHKKILEITEYNEEKKEIKLILTNENLEDNLASILGFIRKIIKFQNRLPKEFTKEINTEELYEIKEKIIKYLSGSRDMTAQYIAASLSTLLPIIIKIQGAAVLAIKASAFNPMIGPNGLSLAKKVFLTCLISTSTIALILYSMQLFGLAVVDLSPFIVFFKDALNLEDLASLFYG
jgi:hypothetical protein